ncbi:MAG TPA: H-X9-DG-CTERM domain-containing protein [Chthoniobacteraceae bacterium]|nr:H-X9-DG-CTERM domain-containing protein [Chthoniobacteraceae bacterium]
MISPPLSPTRSRQGLTLTEVLISIVIITFLGVLLFPVMRGAYESSRQAACVSQLRQISPIFHSYAAEHNGRVRFMRDGGGPMWYTELRNHANLTEQAAKKTFGCPKMRWTDVGSWYCYGMRLGYLTTLIKDDPGFPITRDEDDNGFYGFRLASVKDPARFFLMSDSSTKTGKQSFRIADRKLYSGGGVHLRHGGRANVLFLDGHVESLDAKGLFALNFLQVLDADLQPVNAVP